MSAFNLSQMSSYISLFYVSVQKLLFGISLRLDAGKIGPGSIC